MAAMAWQENISGHQVVSAQHILHFSHIRQRTIQSMNQQNASPGQRWLPRIFWHRSHTLFFL
jgi:hypothetical protein